MSAMLISDDQGLTILIISHLVRHHGRTSSHLRQLNTRWVRKAFGLLFGDLSQIVGVFRRALLRDATANAEGAGSYHHGTKTTSEIKGVLRHVFSQGIHEIIVLLLRARKCQSSIVGGEKLIARSVPTWSALPNPLETHEPVKILNSLNNPLIYI